MLEEFGASATIESVLKSELGEQYELYQKVKQLKKVANMKGVQLRMPYEITIK